MCLFKEHGVSPSKPAEEISASGRDHLGEGSHQRSVGSPEVLAARPYRVMVTALLRRHEQVVLDLPWDVEHVISADIPNPTHSEVLRKLSSKTVEVGTEVSEGRVSLTRPGAQERRSRTCRWTIWINIRKLNSTVNERDKERGEGCAGLGSQARQLRLSEETTGCRCAGSARFSPRHKQIARQRDGACWEIRVTCGPVVTAPVSRKDDATHAEPTALRFSR